MGERGFGLAYTDEIANLACPFCKSDYSHIREVFTRLGSDPHEGGPGPYPGTVAAARGTPERRRALVIVLDGECGHAWEFVIQQHKGVNIVQIGEVATSSTTGPRP